jgi:hypothetical protein
MTGKVAIITAGTPDVGARLVAGYRERRSRGRAVDGP